MIESSKTIEAQVKEDSSEVALEHNEQVSIQSKTQVVRKRVSSIWYIGYVLESNVAYCLLTKDEEPSIFQETICSPYASLWMTAT